MTKQELASALQEVVAKYAGSLQYTVLVVIPGKTPILPIVIGIGLAIALIAAFAMSRRRKVPRGETPKE